MRDQKVVQIKLYPIQFNPVTKELKFYKKIRIRLDFSEVDQLASSPVSRLASSPVLRFSGSPVRSFLFSTPAWADSSPSSLPDFSGPTYKLSLDYDYNYGGEERQNGLYKGPQEGIYKLTYDYLSTNASDLDFQHPETFKVYNKIEDTFKEIPIYIYDGGVIGVFDSDDYIEFYGKITPTKYTSTNVYWLDSGGENGLRMDTKDGTPDSGTTPDSFLSTEHYERDESYLYGVTGEDDRWLFSQSIPGNQSKNFTISLTDLSASPGNNARVKASLYSFYDIEPSPNHHTKVYLNNEDNLIEDTTWDGRGGHSIDESISQGLLEDDNTIIVSSVLDPGVENDRIYANWFEIDYWRDFKASNNSLSFNYTNADETAVTKLFEVSNFDDSNIEVFDITDITNENIVIRITGATKTQENSTYTLEFKDTIPAETNYKYLAQKPLTPTIEDPFIPIEKYENSNIHSPNNEADYIIITHSEFYDDVNLDSLVSHREAQGLRVKVVKISDIYDEFNNGIVSPQAIKDFLTYAYDNWQTPKPTYVLLVGDGHYDYHDNLGNGITNYIPPYLMETENMGETASDDWFVCVSGDDSIPDMYLGRLPVKTTSELGIVINKILDYENAAYTDTWERNILYIADDADLGETIFETTNNSVSNYPSSNYQSNKIYLSSYSNPANCTTAIINAINSGALIVNYVGHASTLLWADEEIFSISVDSGRADIDLLSNAGQLPLTVSMACLDGYFFHPTSECLTEELLEAEGKGAIAVLTSTGITSASEQRLLDEGLFNAFFGGTTNVIGRAVSQAKTSLLANSSDYENIASTFGLFGDPALGLKFPPGEDGHTHGHICPIASAAYGTSLAEEVEVFRNFRDECLLTNKTGRAFVRFYYHHSSSISKFIEKKKALKPIIRAGLKPILWLARRATRPPHKYPIWE